MGKRIYIRETKRLYQLHTGDRFYFFSESKRHVYEVKENPNHFVNINKKGLHKTRLKKVVVENYHGSKRNAHAKRQVFLLNSPD